MADEVGRPPPSFRVQDLDHAGTRCPAPGQQRRRHGDGHAGKRYRQQLPDPEHLVHGGRGVIVADVVDEADQEPVETEAGRHPDGPADAATMTITWRGLIPTVLNVAVSRARSRVLRSSVLKMAAAPITITTAATMISAFPIGDSVRLGSFLWTSRRSGCTAATRRT